MKQSFAVCLEKKGTFMPKQSLFTSNKKGKDIFIAILETFYKKNCYL